MTFPEYSGQQLIPRLEKITVYHQIAFGVSCCERAIPNYLPFHREESWGSFRVLRNVVDMCWKVVRDRPTLPIVTCGLISSCESSVPDSDEFGSVNAGIAQDAAIAICYLGEFLATLNTIMIEHAAGSATSAVDLYVQELENMSQFDPDREQKILTHPLMQRELRRQEEDLSMLEQIPVLTHEIVEELRVRSHNGGKSNLDLS